VGGDAQDEGEGLLVADAVGHRPGQEVVRDDPFGVAAATEQPHHARAAADRAADELRTRDQRQLLLGEVGVLDLVGVGKVDSCGAHLVELLAVARCRLGEVDDVHDLGAAEAGDLHGTHVRKAKGRGCRHPARH